MSSVSSSRSSSRSWLRFVLWVLLSFLVLVLVLVAVFGRQVSDWLLMKDVDSRSYAELSLAQEEGSAPWWFEAREAVREGFSESGLVSSPADTGSVYGEAQEGTQVVDGHVLTAEGYPVGSASAPVDYRYEDGFASDGSRKAGYLFIDSVRLAVPVLTSSSSDYAYGYRYLNLPDSQFAGWSVDSAPLDSSSGTSLVAGHFNFWDNSLAPLSRIYGVSEGDVAVLTLADGSEVEFVASGESGSVDKWGLSDVVATNSGLDGERALVLVTCSSRDGGASFTDNFWVRFVPVDAS